MSSIERTKWSSVSFWFAWVHSGAPGGGRVHSGSRGFSRSGLWIIGFIRAIARFHSGGPRCFRVHSGYLRFTWARQVVVGFIRVRVGSLGRAYGSSGSVLVHSSAPSGLV